jgi:site-specific recombinase XerD
VRNRALIVVLWRGGLRISEALALRPVDVDLQTGAVTILHGKGDQRRVIGLDPMAIAVLEEWLGRRRALGIGPRKALFCTFSSRRARPLDQAYVREMLSRLRVRAGVEKRVHPHGFRHTFTAEAISEGVPLNVVQRQLGHGSLHTTDRYAAHVLPKDVIDRMRSRSWPAPAPPTP